MKVRLLLFLWVGTLLAFMIAGKVQAFTTSPLRYLLTLDPETSQTLKINVANNEEQEKEFELSSSRVEADVEGKLLYKEDEEITNWIVFQQEKFTLKKGESKTIEITLTVPSGATPGYKNLAVLVSESAANMGGVGITAKSAIPISLVVAGEVRESLIIKNWKNEEKVFFSFPENFSINVQNTGTVNVLAKGNISLMNWVNQVVEKKDFSLGSSIYPQAERWLEQIIRSSGLKIPGKYTAKLDINFGANNLIATESFSFWYIPYWSFVVIGALIISGTLFIRREKI